MNNKIIGLLILLLVPTAAIILSGGSLMALASLPSFIFVVGFGGGLTFMKKNKFKFHKLGSTLKKDLTLGGWMGAIISFILYMNISTIESFNLIVGFGMSALPLIYGYTLGNVIYALWPAKGSK
mgnify:CR=1 FL=1|tara:strand:+ start:351 stop:722 length:372 start_codon:yes stop_codon:yes gene_type:complete